MFLKEAFLKLFIILMRCMRLPLSQAVTDEPMSAFNNLMQPEPSSSTQATARVQHAAKIIKHLSDLHPTSP